MNLVKVHEPLAPKSLVQVNGIGPGIVKKVEQRVAEHLSAGGSMAELYQPGAAVPVREVEPAEVASSTSSQPPKRGRKNTGADEDADNASGAAAAPAKRTKKKAYVPAYRSGAYALLMALYENMLKGEQFMTKTRLV